MFPVLTPNKNKSFGQLLNEVLTAFFFYATQVKVDKNANLISSILTENANHSVEI